METGCVRIENMPCGVPDTRAIIKPTASAVEQRRISIKGVAEESQKRLIQAVDEYNKTPSPREDKERTRFPMSSQSTLFLLPSDPLPLELQQYFRSFYPFVVDFLQGLERQPFGICFPAVPPRGIFQKGKPLLFRRSIIYTTV